MAVETKTILLLGDVNSIHLKKWISSLKTDFNVLVFSNDQLQEENKWLLNEEQVTILANDSNLSSSKSIIAFIKRVRQLRKIYRIHQPEITHAHYATSYGLLGLLCHPRNFCISAWGTDIYIFPKTSYIHRSLLKYILKKADFLFATSKNLATEMALYTSKSIEIIPFGIDANLFKPAVQKSLNSTFTVGTVKGLNDVYGIDYLINAFATFAKKHDNCKCVIYGKGIHENNYIQQINTLGMSEKILLKGTVPNNEVPTVLATFDVFCALSRSESFGVAVIEASACELPVIVSDIGGLTEVVQDGKTGFVVEAENEMTIVEKLEMLYTNEALRYEFGKNGRLMVKELFNWQTNIQQQISAYQKIIRDGKGN